MIGRATVFVASLSGTVVALALVAQGSRFGPETLAFALVLLPVALFIGVTTFARGVAVNHEDARWMAGMDLVRRAYLEMVPELASVLAVGRHDDAAGTRLTYGTRQRSLDLLYGLTTTSGVIATLDSVLVGAIGGVATSVVGMSLWLAVAIGVTVSIVSAWLHISFAARYRRSHDASPAFPGSAWRP